MKTILAILAAVFAVSASAQTYGTTAVVSGGTNNVAATATNSYGTVINATRRDAIGLQFSFKCSGTTAVTGGDATLVFVKSLDGTTYDTSNTLRFTLAANSTSTVCLVTNVTLSSAGYLKLSTIENTTTNAITNVSVIYSAK